MSVMTNVNEVRTFDILDEKGSSDMFAGLYNNVASSDENITFDYACEILNTSSMCNLDELKNASLDFIDINASEFINKESFLNISFDTLCEILDHHLCAEEMDIVNATKKWIAANNPGASKIFEIFKHIHLSSISVAEYNSLLVALSSYFTPENLLEFIKEQNNTHNSGTESRACRTIKNVATIEKGAKVIEGLCSPSSLSASEVLFNGEINLNQYVYHKPGEKSITIQLGQPYLLYSLGSSLYFFDSFD
uniref:BACK domain-containing protein n=1 Tax=Acrobeloides nanus TaxID=290746 RepID=A0A914BZW5_9BILA